MTFNAKDAEAGSLRIQEALAEIAGNEDQAEIARLKLVIVELRNALRSFVALHEGRVFVRADDGLFFQATEALRKVDGAEFTSDVVEQQAELLQEALKAIKARIEGEWDNEALDNMLLATTSQDCLHIATEALRKVVE